MKDGIKVDEHANCKSYVEGKPENDSKFEFASFERLNNEVMCNATECLYNKKKQCTVEHLNIGQSKLGAPCIDFEKKE
jgi:hypothetical protein